MLKSLASLSNDVAVWGLHRVCLKTPPCKVTEKHVAVASPGRQPDADEVVYQLDQGVQLNCCIKVQRFNENVSLKKHRIEVLKDL